jgi:hypothetical protein
VEFDHGGGALPSIETPAVIAGLVRPIQLSV